MERSNLANGGNSSCSRRPTGIPPFHPDLPAPYPPVNLPPFLGHSRSLSQPGGFFSLPTSSPVESWTVTRGAWSPPIPSSSPGPDPAFAANGLPPRAGHRRSLSEIPCRPSQSSPMPVLIRPCSVSSKEFLGFSRQQLVKQEMDWNGGVGDRRSEGDNVDDLIDSYMNLDGLGASDSAGMEDKRGEVDGSRLSGSKSVVAESSENETESSLNESGSSGTTLQQVSPGTLVEKKGNGKRSGTGDMYLNVVSSHHCRSLSMDSFMGNLNFADESAKLPVPPGLLQGQHSHNNLFEGISHPFSLEFGNGEFSGAELKKIMANAKLAEIALHDPKRAKRILANRQSAARSKERKVKYVSELEHKVQTLQTEATTLSAQLTLLQRDAAGLTSQNNELRFRLQAMEQQAQLRDALNEALNSEVQRLKLLNAELGQSHSSNNLNHTLNSTFFQRQQQQLQEKETQQEQSSIAVHLPVAEQGRAAAAAKSEGE